MNKVPQELLKAARAIDIPIDMPQFFSKTTGEQIGHYAPVISRLSQSDKLTLLIFCLTAYGWDEHKVLHTSADGLRAAIAAASAESEMEQITPSADSGVQINASDRVFTPTEKAILRIMFDWECEPYEMISGDCSRQTSPVPIDLVLDPIGQDYPHAPSAIQGLIDDALVEKTYTSPWMAATWALPHGRTLEISANYKHFPEDEWPLERAVLIDGRFVIGSVVPLQGVCKKCFSGMTDRFPYPGSPDHGIYRCYSCYEWTGIIENVEPALFLTPAGKVAAKAIAYGDPPFELWQKPATLGVGPEEAPAVVATVGGESVSQRKALRLITEHLGNTYNSTWLKTKIEPDAAGQFKEAAVYKYIAEHRPKPAVIKPDRRSQYSTCPRCGEPAHKFTALLERYDLNKTPVCDNCFDGVVVRGESPLTRNKTAASSLHKSQ